MEYKYIFGPIVSRRFGYSLGIDLSPEIKNCNFDCLYCELKKAKPVNFIKKQSSVENIIMEVNDILKKDKEIDIITITSNGEPTLYTKIDELIDKLNLIKGDKKLLILTNSSTIIDEKIQSSLKKLDIAKFSLDSVIPKTFKKIDRGIDGIKIENIIQGLEEFRKIFKGKLIIEVLIVKNINDKIEEMQELNKILQRIKPDRIDLSTIDRPPAFDVKPITMEKLKEFSYYFENLPVNIAYKKNYKNKLLNLSKNEILSTIKRRPLSNDDIETSFSQKSKKNFNKLLTDNSITKRNIAGVIFYEI